MSTPDFEEQVNTIVNQATLDDNGNLVLPAEVSATAEVLYAAKLAKRQRDTQSAYTKAQQRNRTLEEENKRLASTWESEVVATLSPVDYARLEELKAQDPEAWRQELMVIEGKKREDFATKRNTISKEVGQQTELERRATVLDAFNKANPDLIISDKLIEDEIPPRLTKKLEKGEIAFEEYLEEVKTYLSKGKKIATTPAPETEPGFSTSRGASSPSQSAVKAQSSSDYSKEVF